MRNPRPHFVEKYHTSVFAFGELQVIFAFGELQVAGCICRKRQVTSCFSSVKDCIPALPLFIEGNWRVRENRLRACSLSVEREPVRDRFPGSIPRRGEGVCRFSDSVIADSVINEVLLVRLESFNLKSRNH